MRSHDRTQRRDALVTAFTISALVCANFESPSQALDIPSSQLVVRKKALKGCFDDV